ncbi:arginase family protein [Rhodoligotrophos defluvii]|uniref:arginase family protein n=1 Tax=Rhodoligotrophos defluvii TaxID=2561934 RepID=UPI0010CA14BA|nr:arginase family protein [Rhodoligotrophos defluvii]
MTEPRYAANLPSVGLCTFFRSPPHEDLATLDTDIAFLGIPYDCGIGFRPGTRFGPRDMRTMSVRYSAWGGHKPNGYWDVNQRKRFLKGVRMADCGDVDIAYYDFETNRRNITSSIERILDRGAFPVLIGGDHSVTFPNVCAFSRFGPLDIVHIDAHMDWRDEIGGVKFANASPLRRSKELPFVRNMVHLGIRDVRTSDDQIADAEAAGAMVFTREAIRELGPDAVLERFPKLGNTFVTIDIDGLCPSIAPGTGSPTADGLLYHEVRKILQGVAARSNIVGFDLVEVNPMVDEHGRTSLLASTLILEFLGAIFASRGIGVE